MPEWDNLQGLNWRYQDPNVKGLLYEFFTQSFHSFRKKEIMKVRTSNDHVKVKRRSVGDRYERDLDNLTLPTESNEVSADLSDYFIIVTGEMGIGKTTLAMVEEDVFLISFDPIHKSLKIKERYCAGSAKGYLFFVRYVEMLEAAAKSKKTPFPYKRLVIDGADLWFRACQKWVCKDQGVEHPSDGAYGKVWDALSQEFISIVDRVMALPCGVWFVCHAKDKEIEKRDGTTVEKLRPVLTNRAEEILVGKANALFNIHYIDEDRVCRIRGSEDISAKCNINGHFLTPGGRQIIDIVMGDEGQAEAYHRLMAAYNNEQTYTTYAGWLKQQEKKGEREPKKKRKKKTSTK